MRVPIRSLVVVAAAALVASALTPAAPATANNKHDPTVFRLDALANWEYRKDCDRQPPFACHTFDTQVPIWIRVASSPQPTEPFTVDFLIEEITAVHGVNYTGPTSGTVTVVPEFGLAEYLLLIPILDTGGSGGPDKTLRVSLTGTSLPNADISDTGIGTIHSGGVVPRDCDLSRPDADSFSMTCTDRPAGEEWAAGVICYDPWAGGFPGWDEVLGPTVTGNGTSGASCAASQFPEFYQWAYRVFD